MKTNSQVWATLTAQFKDDGLVVRDFEESGSYATLMESVLDWGSISNPGHTYYVEEFTSPDQVYGHIRIFRDYAALRDFLSYKVLMEALELP